MRQQEPARYPFHRARKQIWMNEQAFPGEAVNTIAIRLYVPGRDAEALRRAVDRVLDAWEIFTLELDETGDGPCLRGGGAIRPCVLLPACGRAEAEGLCDQAEASRLPEGALYWASVRPIAEGGALLSFLFHHILLDGYSMCLAAQEILTALDGGEVKRLPMTEEDEEPAPDERAERAFWLDYFKGLEHESAVLSGSARGLDRTVYRYAITPELSRRIDDYAAGHGVTPAAVFSAALSLYLARATQSPDAVFLMPRLNRDTPRLRALPACRPLVVPVRVRVEDEVDFAALCRLALEQSRAAAAHKDYGLGSILRDLHESGAVTGALSQYTLNFYQPRLTASFPFDIRLSMDGAMHNHLTANITRLQGYYEIGYDGRDGIYDAARTEDFHQALVRILEQGMADRGPVGGMTVVGEAEEARLLAMAGRSAPIGDTDTIPSLFSDAAARFPHRPALFAGERSYTFRELDGLSNRVANALAERGVKAGEPVLFLLERDHRLLPVMLGILKAGASFIPVDPAYPQSRVEYILSDSEAAMMISHGGVRGSEGRPFAEADELLAFPDDSAPAVSIAQSQPAYCIYTSGTTGRPKGVVLSHRGIVNITRPDNNPFNRDICRCGRGIVAVGSVCFDISLFEIFVPLLNGMFVELAPEDALTDPAKIARLLVAHGANLLHCTPSRLSAYLKQADFAAALEGVEAILSAGEVLPGTLVDTLRDRYGIRVYNGYGPTETTIGATITDAGDNQTIGRPIGNTGVMILDGQGRLLPQGAQGELCVWGDGVGIGYRGLPEQTAQRFVTRFGRRMYRTGDLGAFLADGRIGYRGRNDGQVKIRGLRIELAEIENQMLAFPGVKESCVVVRTLGGSQHLVGFYTAGAGETVDAEALRAHLKKHLTYYMVPDVLKQLPAIPQTPGGKADHRALEREPVEYVRIYRAPETRLQKELCAAFEAVLDQSRVGLGDNFFELGGDSLHIADLLYEIEDRLPDLEPAFEDVFQYPTPELLAQHLCRLTAGERQADNLLDELDYAGVDAVLAGNRPGGAEGHGLGTVLLTGATGFLGIHVLLELLRRPEGWERIFCLVRPTERLSADRRLRSALFYYGEEDFGALWGERLFPVSGDLEGAAALTALPGGGKVDTVINCAANVAHFAWDDKLERVNVDGVKQLLSFCKRQGAALVQVSSISVGGTAPAGEPVGTLTERDLYIGQEIRNRYILSKYLAEYETLRAAENGVSVKIMRVGNLQGRLADGEFQMNSRTNAFARRLAAYVKLGRAPRSLYEGTVNFSPVDEVARAIVALAGLPEEYTVFHVYPPEEIGYAALFSVLEEMGHPVRVMEDGAFQALLDEQSRTREGKALLEGILLERDSLGGRDNRVTAEFTVEMLARLGMTWGAVTDGYLRRCLSVLEDYFMFEEGV